MCIDSQHLAPPGLKSNSLSPLFPLVSSLFLSPHRRPSCTRATRQCCCSTPRSSSTSAPSAQGTTSARVRPPDSRGRHLRGWKAKATATRTLGVVGPRSSGVSLVLYQPTFLKGIILVQYYLTLLSPPCHVVLCCCRPCAGGLLLRQCVMEGRGGVGRRMALQGHTTGTHPHRDLSLWPANPHRESAFWN